MKNRRMHAGILVLGVCLLAGTGLAANSDPGAAIQPVLPNQFDENWHGLWEFDIIVRDCDTGEILWPDVYQTPFCEGEGYVPSGGDLECTGSISGSELHVVCTMTDQVEPDCLADMSMTTDMILSQDSITGTQIVETTFTGAGCPTDHTCLQFDMTGTLISTDPVDCDPQSNEAASWSDVKGIYR